MLRGITPYLAVVVAVLGAADIYWHKSFRDKYVRPALGMEVEVKSC